MVRFINTVGFVLRFAPVIVSVVTFIEGVTSKETSGEDKKAIAVATIKEVVTAFGVTVTRELETFISQVIDVVVTILNFLGVFKHRDEVAEEDDVAPVSAETAAKVAEVVRSSPVDARLDELEAILRAS